MKTFLLLILLCLFIGVSNATNMSGSSPRGEREIDMAENAIFSSLIISKNPKSQYLCTQNYYACLGVNQAELGLALMSVLDTESSLSAFINLVRYRLDAGLAEDFECYALKKGKKLLKHLRAMNPKKLKLFCHDKVQRIVKTNNEKFSELDPTIVCSDEHQIKKSVTELLALIEKGIECEADDF